MGTSTYAGANSINERCIMDQFKQDIADLLTASALLTGEKPSAFEIAVKKICEIHEVKVIDWKKRLAGEIL